MGSYSVFSTIAAGFLATVILQVFLFLFGLITRTKIQLFALLGTFAIKQSGNNNELSTSKKVLWTGGFIFYAFGLLFAFLYVTLWVVGIGAPEITDVFIFGFLTGIMALLGLNFLLRNQSQRFKVRLTDYFSPLLIGSAIYAINFLYFYVLIK